MPKFISCEKYLRFSFFLMIFAGDIENDACDFIMMEFRRYNKINCSVFDLIDGNLEVKQTMALGYLFSRSKDALSCFLKLSKKIPKPDYDKYIIDCEAKDDGRIDILIRFYRNYSPIKAIIVEAKNLKSSTKASVAAKQVTKYNSFSHLKGFGVKNIFNVTLTKVASYDESQKNIVSVSWSQLISSLHELTKNKGEQYDLIKSFISFIINIEGGMNYYEEEILSLNVKETSDAVKKTGVYECPEKYKTLKKSLFLTFRGENGEMRELFKLKEKFELDLNDDSAIAAINDGYPDFKHRLSVYKKLVNYDKSCHEKKQVYLLDLDNPIELKVPVIPMENNTNRAAYYSLHEFIQKEANSDIGRVIVQKSIWIDKDTLHIETKRKNYELIDSNENSTFFASKNKYDFVLDPNKDYCLEVKGDQRNARIKRITIEKEGSHWKLMYHYKN